MIMFTIETSITREFHLEESEEIARNLSNMGYELEDKATAKYAISSMPELAALLKLEHLLLQRTARLNANSWQSSGGHQ